MSEVNAENSSTRRVIRRFGTEKTHVIDIPESLIRMWSVFGSDFIGVTLPVIAACGALLGGTATYPVAVCMQPGSKVKCGPCRRLTQIDRAPIANVTLPREALGGVR